MHTKPSISDSCNGSHQPAPVPTLENSLGFALRRGQLHIFQSLTKKLDTFHLTPVQFFALAVIEQRGAATQAELAQRLLVEPPRLVPLLNTLEGFSLIIRAANRDDRRTKSIYISNKGKTLMFLLNSVARHNDIASTSRLTDNERTELLRLLLKLCNKPASAGQR